jgi:hypothetical protein
MDTIRCNCKLCKSTHFSVAYLENTDGSIVHWAYHMLTYKRSNNVYDFIQLFTHLRGLWFSPGTPVSSTNKTDRHDITEILFKVALNTINHKPNHTTFSNYNTFSNENGSRQNHNYTATKFSIIIKV